VPLEKLGNGNQPPRTHGRQQRARGISLFSIPKQKAKPLMASLQKHYGAARALMNSGTTLCFLILPLLFIGCPGEKPSESNPAVPPTASAFNGERAMEYVKKQVEIGPRIPGSPELAQTREYITNALKSSGLAVRTDEFSATTPLGEKKMVNITAEIPGVSKEVIIISSHYDSKYFKDIKFVGANDPGSSVATVLEIGRVLGANQQKPKLTYWLVFFDGEEAFCENWDDCSKPGAPDNTYGSRQYVTQLRKNNELERVRAMILLDLMGYKNLELGRDTLSTRWLQDIIWRTAREMGHGKYFVDRPEGVGADDHESFLRAGIPAVDLIQLNGYPYWHRADDTIDKVSAQSMKVVGETVLASLPGVEQYIQSRPATH
jgi:glutaminyl-peptide cyclotransferase